MSIRAATRPMPKLAALEALCREKRLRLRWGAKPGPAGVVVMVQTVADRIVRPYWAAAPAAADDPAAAIEAAAALPLEYWSFAAASSPR